MAQKRTIKSAKSRANAGEEASPPSRVRCPLATLDNVKAELARVYRQAKGGSIRVEDASKLANILAILGRLIEGADLEARITAIENQRQEGSQWAARH
jgi:hypothetical protein